MASDYCPGYMPGYFYIQNIISGSFMSTIALSEKKLKKIARINGAVKEYFDCHPGIENVTATHLMPLFIRKGIFLKDTENGLPVRVILRELYKTGQLDLLKDTVVMIRKRSYFFAMFRNEKFEVP
jgi:hypothetical protein